MVLGWNEVKERAVQFSKEWENASNEEAEAKQFLIEFLSFSSAVLWWQNQVD
jgi:hypothetical protein